MAVSGTRAFALDIGEILEEAADLAGGEPLGGYEARSAVRSLDLMLLDWSNRGVNLWKVEEETISTASGVADYTMSGDVMDVLDLTIMLDSTTSGNEVTLDRITYAEYRARPNKSDTGRPSEYVVQRQRAAPILTLWPTPNDSDDAIVAWIMVEVQDIGGSTNNPDVPRRFLPALTQGLAYNMLRKRSLPAQLTGESAETYSVKLQDLARLRQELKADYNEAFMNAALEDRERASMFITPRVGRR